MSFADAKSIVFSLDTLHYPDSINHIMGLPRTLNDFFQLIIDKVKKYIHEFCV